MPLYAFSRRVGDDPHDAQDLTQGFFAYYASPGHTVLAPLWPAMSGEVEEIRRDPSCLNGIGVRALFERQ